MAKTITVDVRIADLPKIQQLNASVVALLQALGDYDGLPEPVTAAIERLWRDVEALDSNVAGPVPAEPSDEDRIRDAMAEARDHPGRTITR